MLAATTAEKPGGGRHVARAPRYRRHAGKGGAPSWRRGRCPSSCITSARSSRRLSPARSFLSRRLHSRPPSSHITRVHSSRHSLFRVASSVLARPHLSVPRPQHRGTIRRLPPTTCDTPARRRKPAQYNPALTRGNVGRRCRIGALLARLDPRSDDWFGSWGHGVAKMSRSVKVKRVGIIV